MVTESDAARPPELSIIIPTLQEESQLGETLAAIAMLEGVEVIVVDGGSTDQTVDIARQAGANVLSAARGRGPQLAAGASRARAAQLLFLHADTRVPPSAVRDIREALADERVVAGAFTPHFDGSSGGARFLTRLYPLLRFLGLAYGDSGIFVRRTVYEAIGGFRPYPIFEDLDLLRRLRKQGRFVRLATTVETSSRRFEDRSFPRTFLLWSVLQILFWIGVSPHRLGVLYRDIRGSERAKS